MKGGFSIFTQVFYAFLLLAIVPVTISSFLVAANYDQLVTELSERLGDQNPVTAYRMNRDAMILIAMTIIITAMISLFASLLLSKNLTMPIRRMIEAMRRVARGEFDERVQVRTRDEFALLGRGFNQMVKQLSQFSQDVSSANLRLEQRVAERTAELSLAVEDLRKTSEKINESNRLKTEFVANMSHELRTPLSAIIGFIDLLNEGIYGELVAQQSAVIQKISKNARQLLDLINNVLDLSKIEAGKMEVHVDKFDLAELIRTTADNLRPLFDRKGLLLVVRPEGALPEMEQDRVKIQQILINLLSNALKFTESGSVTIVASEESGRESVRIDVIDTGIGIPLDKQEDIFEQFLQLDGGTARQQGGTGLGLALVRLLVNLLDGTILLESRPNRGSRFTVYLPQKYNKAPEPDEPDEEPAAQKIMVVDDDFRTLAGISEMLLMTDFRIIRCLGGGRAAVKAKEIRPSAIILDALMPGKDGWTVLAELKNDPMTKLIPVIIMEQESSSRILDEAEVFGRLVKPIDPKELQAQLKVLPRSASI